MNKISVTVNGKLYEREVPSNRRLIDFLRDDLGFKGVKEGCSEGECGACTVIFNKKAIASCLLLAAQADGAEITTVEGLEDEKGLHPIQKAFIEAGAVQCGFCIPGMILSAKAILDENPHATEEEIQEAISGNLCRCTGYEKIIEAILLAEKYIAEEVR